MPPTDECVRVVVRCRPLNGKETADGRQRIVDMDIGTGAVTLHNPKADAAEPPKAFTFDAVFPAECTQREVYDKAARPIVASALEGYNGTIFAYGQTGTGKTHTMDGLPTPDGQGIIPNSFDHVFSEVENSASGKQWMVRASFLEIYNEEVSARSMHPCAWASHSRFHQARHTILAAWAHSTGR
jgi:kinesin family protein 3/17